MKGGVSVALLCAALVAPVQAFGQEDASAKPLPHTRTWEFAGAIEVRTDPQDMLPFPLNLELGRYWTTHWKTDMRIVTGRERAVALDAAVLPDGRSTSVRSVIGPFGISSSTTYEFFEHASTRPYGSIGLDVLQFSQSRQIYSAWHQALATDRQHTSVLVRPFVAGGFKKYVGHTRAFMRSDTIIAAGPQLLRNATFHIGAGIDF